MCYNSDLVKTSYSIKVHVGWGMGRKEGDVIASECRRG